MSSNSGQAHFDAFVNDLSRCARAAGKTFRRHGFKASSTEGLLAFLEGSIDAPRPFAGGSAKQKVAAAKNRCRASNDSRLAKYDPAFIALVKVWGTGGVYKEEPLRPVAHTSDGSLVRTVCEKLKQVRIADVDFSESVRNAAKRKRIGGRSLYDLVKKEWEGPANHRTGGGTGALPPYLQHEQAMQAAKLASRGGTMALAHLKKMADIVHKYGYAVCESIAATVIYDCKTRGFKGRMEMVGIKYTRTTGHAIVYLQKKREAPRFPLCNNQLLNCDFFP